MNAYERAMHNLKADFEADVAALEAAKAEVERYEAVADRLKAKVVASVCFGKTKVFFVAGMYGYAEEMHQALESSTRSTDDKENPIYIVTIDDQQFKAWKDQK